MSLIANINNSWVYKHRGVILVLACLILVYFLIQKPRAVSTTVVDPTALQQVKQVRDENNKLYAQINQQVLDKATVQAYSDSLAKALKVARGSIREVDKIVAKDSIVYVTDTSKPISVLVPGTKDSLVIAYSTEFHDPWVDVTAIAGKDTGRIEFKSRDTVTRVVSEETHWFSPTQYNVFLGNSNPHTEITEGTSFSIKEKRTWLSIGPSVQYNLLPTRGVSIGISAQLPLLQFKR